MPTPRKPWTASIYAQLADGEWHDREAVTAEAMRHVAPGVAHRAAEYERIRARQIPGPRIYLRGDPIASGARTVVRDCLLALKRRRAIELDPTRSQLRLTAPRRTP